MGRIVNISGTEIKDHGIQVLADYVKKNLPDEYILVLGCKPYTSDVDGVLIEKGSIFAIEVKDWKGKIKAKSYGLWEKDGTPIDNPLSQARNNAVALAKWLRNRIGHDRLSEVLGSPRKLWVRSLLVFTNPKCCIDGNGLDKTSNTGVGIMTLDGLKDFVMQQGGDERVGQIVGESFDRLDADVGGTIRRGKCIGAIVILGFISLGILMCAAYLIWSQDPDRVIAFVPLGFLILIGTGTLLVIKLFNPATSRGTRYCEEERYGFSAPCDTFDMSNYGQSNAVLTNYIMDFDRD